MIRKICIACMVTLCMGAWAQNAGQPAADTQNYTDINGMKQGPWVKKSVDGTLIYEGFFKDNMPVGVFRRYHPDGKIKAELTYDKKRPAFAAVKMWDSSGELTATGFYNKKTKDSIWEYYTVKEKMVYREHYKNGLRNGVASKYYNTGKLAEEKTWKDGKMHGKWTQYYPDGTIRLKSENKNDLRVGPFIVNHANGKPLVTGQYVNDLQEGTWKVFLETGALEKELKYKNGKLVNADEIDRKLAKEIEEAEKNQGQFADPEKYMNNPEEFMMNQK